jgi:hypothetical protein
MSAKQKWGQIIVWCPPVRSLHGYLRVIDGYFEVELSLFGIW